MYGSLIKHLKGFFVLFVFIIKQTLIDQFNKNGSQIVTHLVKGWSIICLPITFLYMYLENYWYITKIYLTSNRKVLIETARWNNMPRYQGFCNICKNNNGDEYHYIMNCQALKEYRKAHLLPMHFRRPNALIIFT